MSDSVVMMRERLETSCTFIYSYSNTKAIYRRKIRLKAGNAKCRHLKTLTCKETLRRVFICLRIIIHTGKGGRVEPERRLEGQQFTKLGRKYQHD